LIRYEIVFSARAEKSIKALPEKLQVRIHGAIETLQGNPLPPVSRKLVGRDTYRLRVSDYRIIYSIQKYILTIEIISVGHRSEIYRRGSNRES
jgi:mRNA interferase RelE/StbE